MNNNNQPKDKMKTLFITIVGLTLCLTASAKNEVKTEAQATMESRSGSKVAGTMSFTQIKEDLKIDYKITGLKANSTFGFHIHEKGDCSSPDAKSAGSHFHKIAETGGTSKETPAAFAGDLPQIKSDAQGVAEGSVTTSKVSLYKTNPVENLAIMIHGGPDDVTKSSAPRIACGVIKSTVK